MIVVPTAASQDGDFLIKSAEEPVLRAHFHEPNQFAIREAELLHGYPEVVVGQATTAG